MSLNNFVKTIQNIMRKDAGVNGNAQRIEQMAWILFLKIYDHQEKNWEFDDDNYKSIIPEELRWRNWAIDNRDGKALTGDDLLDFVNNKLFPCLKNLELNEYSKRNEIIVKEVFEDNNNYMKDGVLLRQVVNVIDDLNLANQEYKHAFGEIYERILKDLQNARDSGEFYTPRAVTDFMAIMLEPQLTDKIADFACGTGGFLTSVLKLLDGKVISSEDRDLYKESVYGIEKKPLPYMLCVTNMLLHNIDNPNIIHGNSFTIKHVRDYTDEEKFDVVIMNPPFGGNENKSVQNNFPNDLRSAETADLFMSVIMYRLKKNGRAAVILPDGFLFNTDNIKVSIKKKLLSEFNLHTIIRLPPSVFSPYASIATNILFFENTHPTEETWFYRVDMPEGYKHFSKTKPMRLEHFNEATEWWDNKKAIEVDGFDKARKYTIQEIIENDYDLDLCGFPHKEEEILPPRELIAHYQKEKARLNVQIDETLDEIKRILDIE
ncbi:class I SAM-dependent DNA methyltransferase [uncultured Methanobrevibacter sp.]|uniref:class I SAM-dependent DNA methyltransferase n=1 Tax=uncultured Methanobrevibacter sp. TaxID=253161 RepID=UPI0025D42B43|nr:class I SAM-dependent DNA methyltransferase [uncultured Methanobrevibacter sp.]